MTTDSREPTMDPAALVKSEPFLRALVSIIRATDTYGAWEAKPDHALLEEFVITKEARKQLPIIGDPDPEVIERVEQFYRAIGLRIEQLSGRMASPMMSMTHEGFGRILITTGKLVSFAKTLRDVHRFGFDSLNALARDGEGKVEAAVSTIEQFSEVADA